MNLTCIIDTISYNGAVLNLMSLTLWMGRELTQENLHEAIKCKIEEYIWMIILANDADPNNDNGFLLW